MSNGSTAHNKADRLAVAYGSPTRLSAYEMPGLSKPNSSNNSRNLFGVAWHEHDQTQLEAPHP